MKWHNVQQNSDEWFALRVGKIGGSSIGTIMANYGKPFGEPAKKLAVKIALEQLTGEQVGESYTNAHMERGHEQEPIARALYEEKYFCDVTNGGFFENGDIGVSPDGLVYDDGEIEIKCVIATKHFETISRGTYDPSYKWQFFFNLQQTGREWIDFVEYCSEFPQGKRLYEYRIYKKDCGDVFKQIDLRMDEFRRLVDKNKKIIEDIT